MADQQLNKPLYKSDKEEEFTPPIPRPPRASLLGRGAALFVDIMLLHLVFGGIVRFVPVIPLTLGALAPWVGLLLGFLYFGIGFSQYTLGRTFGKLITRAQVADITGPDLPLRRAMARAGLLLLPLPIIQIFRVIAADYAASSPTSALVTLDFLGWIVATGWFLGNAAFAACDPFKRTVYDRLTNSIVINAELEPEPVATYLAQARAASTQPPPKKSVSSLGFALAIFTALAIAIGVNSAKELKNLTPIERDTILGFNVENYGRAVRAASPDDDTATDTLPLVYEIRNHTFIDEPALKADPDVFVPLNYVTNAILPELTQRLQDVIDARLKESSTTATLPFATPPTKASVSVSYVEYPDMFFARYSHPIYTLTREVDISTSLTVVAEESTTGSL